MHSRSCVSVLVWRKPLVIDFFGCAAGACVDGYSIIKHVFFENNQLAMVMFNNHS